MAPSLPDSRTAWVRLATCMAMSTLGSVGMWSVVVVLPAVQAEFGAGRGSASLPYTATMLGYAVGGVAMGRLCDRFGVLRPLLGSILLIAVGYVLAGFSGALWQFALIQGVVLAIGSSATFAPLLAHISQWFVRRRGFAVAMCACGNYLAGAIWPPIIQHFVATSGWRATHIGIGLFCLVTMLPLLLMLRGPAPAPVTQVGRAEGSPARLGLSSGMVQALLCVAGLACCVAMATPQVHIVAYCSDLGYGAARGAQMLSLMLGFGIISRIGSGLLADRIGGLPTLLLSSALQGVALLLYVQFDSLTSLYVISSLFGLFQGGIVPSYAVVVRECFPAREAGMRVSLTIMATIFGMALGGWLSGALEDWTGSYHAAFANGVLWNALNGAVVLFLLLRSRARTPAALSAA